MKISSYQKNNDLSKENYKECLYDNTIEITDTQYIFQMKGAQCDPSETNLVFTYTLDKTAVFKPALEVCKAARKPAPPAPMIATSVCRICMMTSLFYRFRKCARCSYSNNVGWTGSVPHRIFD